MVKFYDAKDKADLARVEAVLKKAGIEYFLTETPAEGVTGELQVAEEDLPKADELLLQEKAKL